MSGRTEPPDWLDELYQEGNNEGPPASVDARIHAAARGQLSARPWYLRARSLASAATIVVGLGITALWMSEPDLAELAAPSPQVAPAEFKEADQPKKRQLQTVASDELREEAAIGTSISSIRDSTPPPPAAAAAAPAELKFQAETANTAAESEPETSNLSEIREAPASPALPGSLQPDNCATLTLIDVGTAAPYALCQRDGQLRVHHASCSQPFELTDQTVTGDRDAQSLIIIDHEQRSQLTCNPETGTWMLQPLPAPQLQQ